MFHSLRGAKSQDKVQKPLLNFNRKESPNGLEPSEVRLLASVTPYSLATPAEHYVSVCFVLPFTPLSLALSISVCTTPQRIMTHSTEPVKNAPPRARVPHLLQRPECGVTRGSEDCRSEPAESREGGG